jgi:hypothetical protein
MKSLLVVLCILCLSLTAMAETPMSLGGQMGINFSSLSVSPSNGLSWSGRTTFVVGGVFEVGISQLFWLQPEVSYVSGGAKTSGFVGADPATQTNSYNFIEVTPLMKLKFGHKDFKPYIIAGPKVGILTGASQQVDINSANPTSKTTDIKDNAESLNLSIDFGAGSDYYIDQQTSLFMDLRYSIGLTNLNKTPNSAETDKTSGFLIMVGAKFRID